MELHLHRQVACWLLQGGCRRQPFSESCSVGTRHCLFDCARRHLEGVSRLLLAPVVHHAHKLGLAGFTIFLTTSARSSDDRCGTMDKSQFTVIKVECRKPASACIDCTRTLHRLHAVMANAPRVCVRSCIGIASGSPITYPAGYVDTELLSEIATAMRHSVVDVAGGPCAYAADLRGHIVQSGIDNHRTALWTQVRTAFRSHINETDEDKVGVLVSLCGHSRPSLPSALPARPLCTPGHVSCLQIDEQKDA